MKLPRKSKATEPATVSKRRGRPRKQRRKEKQQTVTDELKKISKPIALIGRFVSKEFSKNDVRIGKVVSYSVGIYRVEYEEGEREDLESGEIRRIMLEDCDFDDDDDLIRRKNELEESVVKKIDDESKKNLSELNVEDQEEIMRDVNDVDVDSSSDDEMQVELPQVELPPELMLPPSSGTFGVPEDCVANLLSVYGFLRSFSTRLFLSPFTLDEFVGALNCGVSNTLLDAIHVSLMKGLRRHLENLSTEGSKIALKCLRSSEWSLLDTLTWPVFLIQYLAVNGYTKGSEWKGFYDEIFRGEYYSLPASRKLIILQILCNDVLESEELRAEMDMREEIEAGKNYDAEDIPPAEKGPKRVHRRYDKTADRHDEESTKFVSKLDAVNLPGNSEDELDRNGDECRLCGMDGTLLCCDGCPSVYHSRCIGVMKMYIPEGKWYCPECKINMTGPKIAQGTSLRGAVIFGNDLYGQTFMGTCDHLLVLNGNSGESCRKYYNQNDIPEVIRVLYASVQHRPIYSGICMAMLQYWNIPESFLHLCVPNGTNLNSENSDIDENISAALHPHVVENDHKGVSLGKAEYGPTSSNGICSDNMVPSLDVSLVTSSPTYETSGDAIPTNLPNGNIKLHKETVTESVVSTVNHQSAMCCPKSDNKSSAVIPAKYSLVSNRFINCGHAIDTRLPMHLSLQTKGDITGSGKWKVNITNDFVYSGCSYKPQSYINNYMHGDFAASAAANLAILSSEDSRPEGRVSDLRKAASENTNLLAKAFSLTASRFFWPSSDKKFAEIIRERCGWCLSCKALVSSKKGCMLNHATICATKNAVKFLSGLTPVRSGEGISPAIATYVIYIEESLHGLIDGPFLSRNCRKQWREQVERAASFSDIKPLLLKLEENIRAIAFCGEWVKPADWLNESLKVVSATPTLGTTQERAPCDRCRKLPTNKYKVGTCEDNLGWWNGKFTKSIFQKAALPQFLLRKAARQGGLRKILGIAYPKDDVPDIPKRNDIPKRSRQLLWRAAVQMSRHASQLAHQVRYLDFHIRWTDLTRPEYNLQDGKGQDAEVFIFRNAKICAKDFVKGTTYYGIDFGSQKHISSWVQKNAAKKEEGPEGTKYWFSETRSPLYLVKEYEVRNKKEPSHTDNLNVASQRHKRRLNAMYTDIFFYLACKRDKLDMLSCSVCKQVVLLRNALKCSACQGYCHGGCSINSTFSTYKDAEFLTTCKCCYHTSLLAQKETINKSSISPLLLKGREHSSSTMLKKPEPKCDDQIPRSTRVKDFCPDMKKVASNSPMETKSSIKKSSWGIIWKKNNSEDTGIDFRLKNIILKQRPSSFAQFKPVCHLCHKPYSSDLMYIGCETCDRWYHAEALELEESKIFSMLGFKCCRCRKIKSPVCPYSDSVCKEQVGEKSHPRASKKKNSGVDPGSGTLVAKRAREPVTPIFPLEDVSIQENNPLPFSLSNVEPITEHKSELVAGVEGNVVSGSGLQKIPEDDSNGSFGGEVRHAEISTQDVGVEGNIVSGSGLQKIPEDDSNGSFGGEVRHTEISTQDAGVEGNIASGSGLQKIPEDDSNGCFGGEVRHAEISTQEAGVEGNVASGSGLQKIPEDDSSGSFGGEVRHAEISTQDVTDNLLAEVLPPFAQFDPLFSECGILNDSEIGDNEFDLSLSDLLPLDNSSQFEEPYVLSDLSGFAKDSSMPAFPEESPTMFTNRNAYSCCQCSQTEPAPDLFCQICQMWIHSKCSPWIESPSRLGDWRCGNCRLWQ